MNIAVISGHTRVLGQSQGYRGLPIRDQKIPIVRPVDARATVGEAQECFIREMVSAWQPTPAELEALNAGATVYVHIQGELHPPIKVEVGPPV